MIKEKSALMKKRADFIKEKIATMEKRSFEMK